MFLFRIAKGNENRREPPGREYRNVVSIIHGFLLACTIQPKAVVLNLFGAILNQQQYVTRYDKPATVREPTR